MTLFLRRLMTPALKRDKVDKSYMPELVTVVSAEFDAPAVPQIPPPLSGQMSLPWEADLASHIDEWLQDNLEHLPTFTIVTPCFNSVEFLEKTIRSVLLQSYPKIDWIIMDGGSTDGTLDVIRYYERFFTSWVSEPDAGQSDALNKGFARSEGEVLCWLNADDLFLPGALAAVAKTWVESERADFIVANADLVDQNLDFITRQTYENLNPESLIDYRKNYLIQPGVFFSKRAWDECGPLALDLDYAMDFELFYKMAQRYSASRCNSKVAYSVFHSECKTVKHRVFSIIETALLQARLGRIDIAKRELLEIGKEHKFLENHFHRDQGEKKVLFVITELGLGGAQTFLLRTLREFTKKHKVYLYVYFKHTLEPQFTHLIPRDVILLTEFDLGDPAALGKMIDIIGVHAVFSHLYHADRLCAAALADRSVPLILTDHGDFKVVDRIGLASLDEMKQVLLTAHTIIVTSDAGIASFNRFGPAVTGRLTKIPLGVDAGQKRNDRIIKRRFLGVSEVTFVFMCSARGTAEKGWLELYSAFVQADALTEDPLELWCLGTGEAIDNIRARASLEGRTNIRFFGFQRNVQDYLAAADCVVLFSKFQGETLNLSVMEALPMGLPVIATDIGAIRETVGTGKEAAGFLIPLSQATGGPNLSLAVDAMVSLVGNELLRKGFGEAARRRAKLFDMKQVAAKTLELMEWAVSNPRNPK